MFISNCPSGYTRSGEQFAGPGEFLILMQGESPECQKVKGVVRSVRMLQFGHFMMGRTKIGDYKMTLSGSYGADGLICTVPDDIYLGCGLELPQELYDAWNKGEGWNSAGKEAPSMRTWANANLAALKKAPKKIYTEFIGAPNLDGMNEDELAEIQSLIWKRTKSIGREWFPGHAEEAETAVGLIRQCAHWTLEARRSRLSGHVDHAKYIEDELLERDYKALPEWARW